MTLCGIVLGLSHRDGYSDKDVRRLLAIERLPLDELVAFDGCIEEEVTRQGGEQVATIELRGVRAKDQWIACRGRLLLRIPELAGEGQAQAASLNYADRVRGWAEWNRPRNFQNPGSNDRVGFLARRDIFLVGRIKSPRVLEVLRGDCGTGWKRAAFAVRARIRSSLASLADRGFHREAPILASLLIGDYSALDRPTREAFQNAGTYHVLVVSGLHVGWIAWLLVRLLRILRVSEGASRFLVAGGLIAYAAVVGFQASITRSVWMFLLFLCGQALFRNSNPTNSLMAAACLLLVMRPDWLVDIGFQFSFISVLSVFLMGLPLIERTLLPVLGPLRHAGEPERLSFEPGWWQRRGRRWRTQAEVFAEACADRGTARVERFLLATFRKAASGLFYLAATAFISVSVQIWLGPMLAFYFNRLSWISPAANLLIVPLSSFTLAAGALGTLLALIFNPPLAFGIATWSCLLLLRASEWISELPGAWQRCPTPAGYLVACGLFMIFVWRLFEWRALWISCSVITTLLVTLGYASFPPGMLSGRDVWPTVETTGRSPVVRPPDPASGESLRLTFLDVGQGDSVVIQFPNSAVWVLDAGGVRELPEQEEGGASFDIGEAVVSRYLWSMGIRRLERLVLSHPHQDHAGGMPALMKNFTVGRIDYGEPGPDATLSRLLASARANKVPFRRLVAGETQSQGEVRLEWLNPPQDGTERSINNNSLVVRLVYRRFSALLTGDLEKEGESEVVSRAPDLSSTLLKVAHHGSRSATLLPFLSRTQPRWAVLSAGRNNPFGHPSKEVLLRLIHQGALPLLTLDQGAITLETDGERYVLSTYVSGVLARGVF
jgi:competence protein ComEC